MHIEYRDNIGEIDANMLTGFFEGWLHPHTPSELLEILRASTFISLAFETDSKRVVGFVNALSDGIQAAFIPLLEVLPEYQHHGIGTALVRRILNQLSGIGCIDLTCDTELQPFYARFGMRPAHGMILRRTWGLAPPREPEE